MRILFVSTMNVSSWGGSEELWAATAGLAIDNGHQISCSVFGWREQAQKILDLQKKGATFYQKTLRLETSIHKRFVKAVKRRVFDNDPEIEFFRQFKPDIVCYSQGDSFSAAENRNYREYHKENKIPYILVSQLNFEFKKYDKWDSAEQLMFIKNAKKFLFVSRRNLETARMQLLDKLENADYINNPVNLSSNTIEPFPNIDKMRFASVARLDVIFKRQDLLIHILAQNKWKERDWVLNLYGSGQDDKYLKKVINYCRLGERVVIHGHNLDIRDIWRTNHILLMPSYAEGTPLALMEAMICGRTSVVTDVGGNVSLVREGITGFISPASTFSLFDDALERACQARDNWKQMGENAHSHIIKEISLHPEKDLLDMLLL